MKNSEELIAEKFLLLFKLDAMNLFSRVLYRKPEYVTIFALKRTRDHFTDIFQTRYRDVTMGELAHCQPETIQALNDFYEETDSIRWYLLTTEDMPNSVSDELDRRFIRLEELHNALIIQIDSELGIESNIQMGTVKELQFDENSESEEENEAETADFSEDEFTALDNEEMTDFSSTDFQDFSDSTEN